MPNITPTGADLESVIEVQSDQIVKLQKIVAFLARQVSELEAALAKERATPSKTGGATEGTKTDKV